MTFDAVVLAGGDARRLDGLDKTAIEVGGRSLLDLALEAVNGAREIVVVGPRRRTSRPVRWTSESPAGGGPLRATIAGLELVRSDVVVVLAVDYPFVTPETVAELIRAARSRDGAALQDEGGSMHYVVGAYQTEALRAAVDARPRADASMRSLFVTLDLAAVRADRAALDIDTPEDLERARAYPPGDDEGAS
jgi:molybdopterin-guanine dinucleotide biosynthesis protein A